METGNPSLESSRETARIDALPLMEDFYTIQGEGFYQGHAAYFIRLGGCDVGCVWCDVKESWDVSAHPPVTTDEMVRRAKASGTEMVVITGGEPVMYNLEPLTAAFRAAGLRTNLETSGASPIRNSYCMANDSLDVATSTWA